MHWKLSSKWDQLIVKERAEAVTPLPLLTLDRFGTPGEAQQPGRGGRGQAQGEQPQAVPHPELVRPQLQQAASHPPERRPPGSGGGLRPAGIPPRRPPAVGALEAVLQVFRHGCPLLPRR